MKRLILVLLLWAAPLTAVEPDEILSDPALEARARDISAELRCLVCRNESIDESNAELARDLRLLVRERLVAGDSDEEVVAYIVARYGEFVLLNPPARGSTWLLWLAGPVLAVFGVLIALSFLRGRATGDELGEVLSAAEQERLEQILKK